MIVVDSGFSFTHVVPILNGSIVWDAVKRFFAISPSQLNYSPSHRALLSSRIDIGGKLLTNHLKELVSYRQWNMMDQTYIMNDVKERCCYVSSSYNKDLDECKYVSCLNCTP